MDDEETRFRDEWQKREIQGRGSGAVCCFLIVVLVVGAVAISGLVLSIAEFTTGPAPAVNVNDYRTGHVYEDEEDSDEDYYDIYKEILAYEPGPYNPDEVWLIQFDVDDGNLEYMDTVVGQIKGFNIDVVNAVCRRANKNCRIVFDSYSRCWSGGYGGEGLVGRWYHACSGWRVTTDRQLTYKFSDPFQKQVPAYFVTSRSNSQFDSTDLTGKKIGLRAGWFSDEGCLNRQDGITGLPLNDDQIIIYPNSAALEDALNSGEIDASFTGADLDFVSRSTIVSDEINCLVEGAGMMMRKDTHLEKWWNPAWKSVLASDEYRDICDDVQRVHGHKPGLNKDLLCRDKAEDLHPYRRRKR